MPEDPVTDLTVAGEVNYFRQAKDRYFVPVSVQILGSDVELAKRGGAESTRLVISSAKSRMPRARRSNGTGRDYGEAEGRDAGADVQAEPGVRHRIYPPAGDVDSEVSGSGKRDWKSGHLRGKVHGARPEHRVKVPADQFGGVELSA